LWGVLEVRAALPDGTWQPLIVLNVLNLPWGWGFRPTFDTLQIVYYVGIVAGLFSLVGLATNIALLVFATSCVYMHAFVYSFGDFHHPEAVMMVALCALALSPSGRALSLDAWLGRRRRRQAGGEAGSVLDRTSEFAAWPIKLLMWFFVLMYASAVWNKLAASGLDWANGYTLQYVLARDGLRWDSPLGYWLSHHHVLVLLTQYAVLLFQATFALAVIFPKLRWIYVPVGLGFHIAIFLTLTAPFFQWIALYAVFIPWAEALRLYRARSGGLAQPAAGVG
ncbi:MAG: HTTM domain-containing protein, partial [Geminicoccales bacterium]